MKVNLLLIIQIVSQLTFAQTIYSINENDACLQRLPKERTLNFRSISPPPGPVRHMAEWEELQALVITWRSYPAILREIVRHAAKEVRVIIICRNSEVKDDAVDELVSNGVPLENVQFLITNNNSVWIRDYGPNCVYSNDTEELHFIDWIYNRRSRPYDDIIPGILGQYFDINVFATDNPPYDLVATGGNFMSDGLGNAFSSKLILNENSVGNIYNVGPHAEYGIDEIMKEFLGIQRYVKMENLPFDGIHHLDMHMRLLDEETLLIGQYPPGISDGPQIEANIEYLLSHFDSPFGTPYKIIRIPQPPDFNGSYPPQGNYRTYTNSVFINKTILVPTYEERYDTTALRIYREFFPGYKISGINCNQMIAAFGALHCITKEIGTQEPVWIVHKKKENIFNNSELGAYEITASAKSRSGIMAVKLFYTTDTLAGFQSGEMTSVDSFQGRWSGYIPHQADEKTIYYFIQAESNSGKKQVRPIAAPQGYYKFQVRTQPVNSTAQEDGILFKDIFPNPAKSITVIPVHSRRAIKVKVEITNVVGRTVRRLFDGIIPEGESKFFIDAAKYTPGTYFISITSEKSHKTQKLMIR